MSSCMREPAVLQGRFMLRLSELAGLCFHQECLKVPGAPYLGQHLCVFSSGPFRCVWSSSWFPWWLVELNSFLFIYWPLTFTLLWIAVKSLSTFFFFFKILCLFGIDLWAFFIYSAWKSLVGYIYCECFLLPWVTFLLSDAAFWWIAVLNFNLV